MGKPKLRNRRFNSGVGKNSFRYKVRKRKENRDIQLALEQIAERNDSVSVTCTSSCEERKNPIDVKKMRYKIVRKKTPSNGNIIVVKRLLPISKFRRDVRFLRLDQAGTRLKIHVPIPPKPEGYRLIGINQLSDLVKLVVEHVVKCPNPDFGISETGIKSFASTLCFTCKSCGEKLHLTNSFLHPESGFMDINVRAVWGSMTSGAGPATLNEIMATLGVGTMRREVFGKTESFVGDSWLKLLEEDMKKAGDEERRLAIERQDFHQGVPAITVICDGGWSKRSHRHTYNALGGVAVIFGAETGQLLHIGVRNKYCSICSIAESKKVEPPSHECFKNWTESSQAMESDIIVEGFIAAERVHGLRYMRMIGDGDSSVYGRIQEQVPVWGRDVKKLECANHVCKCLRSSLEKLIEDKPHLKGKGRLTKNAITRITRGVRCAIRLRSSGNKKSANSILAHDIRNTVHHVFGDHSNCSDFCQKRDRRVGKECCEDEDAETKDDDDDDGLKEAETIWREMMDEEKLDESRLGYDGDDKIDLEILKDVRFLLDRVAMKSSSLIGNFTTNLAESWMSIRCKFDGGKMKNRCQRGSWHARCYGGALRKNFGAGWSPVVWQRSTGISPSKIFTNHYHQRAHDLKYSKRYKRKPETKVKAAKRKAESAAKSNSKKARREYGNNCLDGSPDVSPEQLEKSMKTYLASEIDISSSKITEIEKTTTSQSFSATWITERKKRLTSSNFGDIIRKSTTAKAAPYISRLLYNKFSGNKYTRKGLQAEGVTIKEYTRLKGSDDIKVTVKPSGLIIDKEHKFLAASPDGIVEGDDGTGLVEIKNLLQNSQASFEEAAKKSTFCLESNGGKLTLRHNHNYYYQCQGQLNICKIEWLDFIVRRTNPYQIHIERIYRDKKLWDDIMVPKLSAFYHTCLLPELASPRHNTLQGIREPQKPWYTSVKSSCREVTRRQKKKNRCLSVDSSDSDAAGPSTVPEVRHTSKRQRRTKFVGRHILHQWCTDEATNTLEWYEGTVLDCIRGIDGNRNAVYEVLYKGENEPYEVDNLQEDLNNGSLQFKDL